MPNCRLYELTAVEYNNLIIGAYDYSGLMFVCMYNLLVIIYDWYMIDISLLETTFYIYIQSPPCLRRSN